MEPRVLGVEDGGKGTREVHARCWDQESWKREACERGLGKDWGLGEGTEQAWEETGTWARDATEEEAGVQEGRPS